MSDNDKPDWWESWMDNEDLYWERRGLPCQEVVDWVDDRFIPGLLDFVECAGYPVYADCKCIKHTACKVEEGK